MKLLSEVIDFLDYGLVVVDLDNRVTKINQKALDILNIKVFCKSDFNFRKFCNHEGFILPIFPIKGGALSKGNIRNYKTLSEKFQLSWSFKRCLDDNEQLSGVIIFVEDISEDEKLRKERDYLDSIIAQLPGNFYWKNRKGVYQGCNNNTAEYYHFSSRSDVVGITIYDVESNLIAARIQQTDDEIMETGKEKILEEWGETSDDDVFLSYKVPFRNKNDEIIGLLGVSFKLTERIKSGIELNRTKEALENIDKENTEALAHMAQQITGQVIKKEKSQKEYVQIMCDYYENLIAVMPGNIYWMDRNGVYLGCNDNCAKYDGFTSRQQLVGKTIYDLFEKTDAELMDVVDQEVMSTNTPKFLEEVSESQEIFLTNKVPLHDSLGNVIGMLGISFDITDKKRQERQLQESKLHQQAQDERIRTLETVGASIAHELRTPLGAIGMQAEGLASFVTDLIDGYRIAREANLDVPYIQNRHLALLEKSLDSIDAETRFAFTVIDMFLMNIQMTLADKKDMEECSMRDCLDQALKRYPMSPKEHMLIHWDRKQDFKFLGKSLWIVHILFNLLKNAIYYVTKAGKGDIEIWMVCRQKFNELHFKDTGTGISKEVLPHVFDHFFSKTHGGTGIGLAFCQRTMQNLGGKIDCYSHEGEFTEFVLSFPILKHDVSD